MPSPFASPRLALSGLFVGLLLAGCGASADSPRGIEKVAAVDGDLVPRYEPDGDGFYRMPWPSDFRVTDQGTVDVSDIPGANRPFVAKYVDMLATIHGFSTMPVAYIPFTGDVVPADDALPSPKASLEPDSPIQLIDLSDEGCGQRTPVETVYDKEGDEYIDPNTLKIAPIPGWPLRRSRPYAFIVTTKFGGSGHATARPQAFADYLNGEGDDQKLDDSFEPLRKCLPKTNLKAKDIALATVFTTQDPIAATRKLRQKVWSNDVPIKPISDWYRWQAKSTSTYTVYHGTAHFPIFQKGHPPYSQEGGLVFNSAGRPVIQRWEDVPIAVTVPVDHPNPLKLLIWEDGTGAWLGSHIGDKHIVGALDHGFAVATFVPQFHHGRGTHDYDPEMDTFNYTNPVSGRTVFRQQIAETSYFIRLLEDQLPKLQGMPTISTSRIFYGGHSQGALVGAMVAGVEPRIDTYMLSGVGSYLSETVIYRKEPFDVAALVQNLLGVHRAIDRFHPIVQMAQLGADVIDPHNYARFWKGFDGHEQGSNVFIIDGKLDQTTATISMNALMTVADVPPAGTPGWDVDPYQLRDLQQYDPPVEANRQSLDGHALTFGAFLSPDNNHFTLYDNPKATKAAINFWATAAEGQAAIDF